MLHLNPLFLSPSISRVHGLYSADVGGWVDLLASALIPQVQSSRCLPDGDAVRVLCLLRFVSRETERGSAQHH